MTRPSGAALVRLMVRRVETLRREHFSEGEIRILVDRRLSSRGVLQLRRERKREIRDLSPAEMKEWLEQLEEAHNEDTVADDLRRVSPEE